MTEQIEKIRKAALIEGAIAFISLKISYLLRIFGYVYASNLFLFPFALALVMMLLLTIRAKAIANELSKDGGAK